jgi:hypothetical protein
MKSNLVVSIIFGLEDLSASILPDNYDSETTIVKNIKNSILQLMTFKLLIILYFFLFLKNKKLLSIILQNTPRVNPFTMKSQGSIAYRLVKHSFSFSFFMLSKESCAIHHKSCKYKPYYFE